MAHLFHHKEKKEDTEYTSEYGGGYEQTTVETVEDSYDKYEKEEKQHKHKEHLGEVGTLAAGAFALVYIQFLSILLNCVLIQNLNLTCN
jgi:ABA/WDS induced protein